LNPQNQILFFSIMVSNSYNHSNPTEIKKTIFTARTNKKNTEVTKFIKIRTGTNRPLPWRSCEAATGNHCFDGLQLVQQDATGAKRPGQTDLCRVILRSCDRKPLF
jgi:hypothetical protein